MRHLLKPFKCCLLHCHYFCKMRKRRQYTTTTYTEREARLRKRFNMQHLSWDVMNVTKKKKTCLKITVTTTKIYTLVGQYNLLKQLNTFNNSVSAYVILIKRVCVCTLGSRDWWRALWQAPPYMISVPKTAVACVICHPCTHSHTYTHCSHGQ